MTIKIAEIIRNKLIFFSQIKKIYLRSKEKEKICWIIYESMF